LLFNSDSYLIFLPLVVLAYYQLAPAGRRWLLLAASYVFYASSALTIFPPERYPQWSQSHWLHEVFRIGSLHTALVVFTTVFNYTIGRLIGAAPQLDEIHQQPGTRPPTHSHHADVAHIPHAARRRFWLILSLVVNLGVLCLYKYLGFLSGVTAALMGRPAWQGLEWILPLGISFYTFEVISYDVDVYLGLTRPIRRPLDMFLYVSFFPHLIAGPIIRSEDLVPQLGCEAAFDWANIRVGIARFVYGMCKKVYFADVMAKVVAEYYGDARHASGAALLLATYAFAVQIYCDFSAYSDMAIGSALMLGLKLPENFDAPYLACGLREFWRRWHISLSTWLRDYLYIPLGGSRVSVPRTYLNLMITMILGGLWHGAGWAWVIWGGAQGAVMSLERSLGISEKPPQALAWKLVRWTVTFHIVCASWILFRAKDPLHGGDLKYALLIFQRIVTNAAGTLPFDYRPLVFLGIVIAAEVLGLRKRCMQLLEMRPVVARWLSYAAALVFVLTFAKATNPEFIYFQF
jgi:D-alanyl-lipoteichoic acid acyltransferase DltB (MBOAT superfamily)